MTEDENGKYAEGYSKGHFETVGLDYVLQPGDCVVITPRCVEGAAPVPKLRDFKRFLRRSGHVQLAGTATDHENWESSSGEPLKVNPANGNRSEVDLASFKACASLEGVSMHKLYERM